MVCASQEEEGKLLIRCEVTNIACDVTSTVSGVENVINNEVKESLSISNDQDESEKTIKTSIEQQPLPVITEDTSTGESSANINHNINIEKQLPSSTSTSAVDVEQRRIDEILKKLFFSPKNVIVSEDVTFDPLLR